MRTRHLYALPVIALAMAYAHRMGWQVVDDAGISLLYGQNFFRGLGFRITALSQEVEAFSSAPWTVLLGLSVPLHVGGEAWARWLGMALGAWASWVASGWVRNRGQSLPVGVRALASLWASALPCFAAWSSSGMETGYFALVLAYAGRSVLQSRDERGISTGLWLGLLAISRPEGPLYVAAACLFSLGDRASFTATWRRAFSLGFVAAAVFASYLAFRWLRFADIWPNTYWAKRLFDFGAKDYVGSFFVSHARYFAATAGLGALSLFSGWARFRTAALALSWVLCTAAFAFWARGDWMGEWRFLVHVAPLLAAVASAGLASAYEGLSWGRRSVALSFGAAAFVAFPNLKERHAISVASSQFYFEAVKQTAAANKAAVDSLGIARPTIGVTDLGGFASVFANADIVDLAGLGDRAMAWHTGNLKAQEDYLLFDAMPDVFDAHGPAGHFVHYAALASHVQGLPGTGLRQWAGLTSTHDPRCPAPLEEVRAWKDSDVAARLGDGLSASDPVAALKLLKCAHRHKPEALPPRVVLDACVQKAAHHAEEMETQGKTEAALRWMSLATTCGRQDNHLRRKTEKLRERLHPRPPPT